MAHVTGLRLKVSLNKSAVITGYWLPQDKHVWDSLRSEQLLLWFPSIHSPLFRENSAPEHPWRAASSLFSIGVVGALGLPQSINTSHLLDRSDWSKPDQLEWGPGFLFGSWRKEALSFLLDLKQKGCWKELLPSFRHHGVGGGEGSSGVCNCLEPPGGARAQRRDNVLCAVSSYAGKFVSLNFSVMGAVFDYTFLFSIFLMLWHLGPWSWKDCPSQG